ncbi:MAG TPA: sigma-70 family RNA polymerase sigma factor [Byssovorax sp.]
MIEPGARAEYAELYERLRPFVARRVATSDVDDVVQDVFVRMQRALPDLRDEERFGPWVYRVARSAIVDHRRVRARHPLPADEPSDEPLPLVADDVVLECEMTPYVSAFVALLPSPYREALTLTELEGLTQREAAAMRKVTLSTMKSHVQRGRVRLRELFEACCEIGLDARGRVIACAPRSSNVAACGCDPRADRDAQ